MSSQRFLMDFAIKYASDIQDSQLFVIWSALRNYGKSGRIKDHITSELKDKSVVNLNFKESIEVLVDDKSNLSKGEIFDSNLKIKTLQVKNFKGFSELTNEDKGTLVNFIEDKNIFFAPNGGGKTSLCNALEYTLTGNVKEAKRRNLTVPQYVRHNGKRPQVSIEFSNSDFELSDLNDYQKSILENAFIEHNRINAFALLGSRDSGDNHQDIISYVLGLEDLDDFVSYFIKPESMKLAEVKSLKANEALNNHKYKEEEFKQRIEYNRENIQKVKTEIKSKLKLNGAVSRRLVKRKLKTLDEQVKEKAKQIKIFGEKDYPKIDGKQIVKLINSIKRDLRLYDKLSDEIESNIEQVNLANIYEAIEGLNEKDYDICPACRTNLEKTEQNPFEYAKQSLQNFREIQSKQCEKRALKKQLENQRYNQIREIISLYNIIINIFSELKSSEINEVALESKLNEVKKMELLRSAVDFFENKFLDIKKFWYIYTELDKQRSKNAEEIEKLSIEEEMLTDKITDIKSALSTWEREIESIGSVREKLGDFIKESSKLIKENDVEVRYNQFIERIEESYRDLYNKLIEYKNNVQSAQLSGTESSILKFYTRMNDGDSEQEMINDISFELTNNKYNIMIEVNSEKHNAFSKLSEGHLRSLGLSIMLAVAEKNNLPFLIFDDVVNAIDTEHRANIIDLIYTDEYISNIQLIITTHDRLFWERFCNQYKYRGSVSMPNISNILEYTNKGIIIKNYNVDFASKIQSALQSYDVRQALVYCRLWFETIAMEYCRDKNVDIKGRITSNSTYIMMKPNLEDMYKLLAIEYGHTQPFIKIKNDLINWQGQNQEHHAFEESSYNFVHAKTSDEVDAIFEAIFELSLNMFEQDRVKYRKHIKAKRNRHDKLVKKLNNPDFMDNAPPKVRNRFQMEKAALELKLKKSERYMRIIDEVEKVEEGVK